MMSELTARLLPQGDWRRRLHAPYRIIIQDTLTNQWVKSDATPHAEGALSAMIDTKPFPLPNQRQAVIDADGWIVFGYSTQQNYVEAFGSPAWWGSEIGFALIESAGLIEPMELAIIESDARDASDEDEWWK